jgi:hypothetical protein
LRLKKSPAKDFVSLKRQIQEDERRKNRIQKTNVSRKSRIDGLFEKNHRLTNIRFYYDDLLRFSDYTPVQTKKARTHFGSMCIIQNLNTPK